MPLLVDAEGSDSHFLCRVTFSFTVSLLDSLCLGGVDSWASISTKTLCWSQMLDGEGGWTDAGGLPVLKSTRHDS